MSSVKRWLGNICKPDHCGEMLIEVLSRLGVTYSAMVPRPLRSVVVPLMVLLVLLRLIFPQPVSREKPDFKRVEFRREGRSLAPGPPRT